MLGFGFLRKRINSNTTGANGRIVAGDFGQGRPMLPFVKGEAGPMLYHEGDLFTPGAQNYVAEPIHELPLITVWGFGYLYPSGNFDPRQPSQVFAPAHIVQNGLGGLVAGQIATQPLSDAVEQGGA